MTHMKYRADIDGLRAIAVSVVVIYHLHIGFFTGGYVGVDVFFVISGYLITNLINQGLDRKSFSILSFYSRRFRRLFPALIFTLVVATLLAALLLTSEGFQDYGQEMIAAIFSVSNFYFWSSAGYFDTEAIQKPLLHTWSLSVEEQFYMFWPIILIFFYRFGAKKYIPLLLFFMVFTSLAAAEIMVKQNPNATFFLLPFRTFELALGGILALNRATRFKSNLHQSTISFIGLGMIAFSIVVYNDATSFPGVSAMVPCVGAFLIIYAGPENMISKLLSKKIFVFTGLISYSWYLIHWPVLVFWKYYTLQDFGYIDAIGFLIITYLVAAFMYKFVECPLRRGDFYFLTEKGIVLSLLSIMLAFGLLGLAIDKSGGFPERITEAQNVWKIKTGKRKTNELTEHLSSQMPYGYFQIRGGLSDEIPKMMITGDSHAGRLAAFGYYFHQQKPQQVIIAWRTACFPLLDMTGIRATSEGKGANCSFTRRKFLSAIQEHKVDTVVLAGRWLPYLGGEYPSQELGKKRYFIQDGNQIKDVNYSKKYLEKLLDETVQVLVDNNVNVILMSQVPPPADNLRGCNGIPTFLMSKKKQLERCRGQDRFQSVNTLAPLDQIMTRVAAKHNQLAILPSKYFCPESQSVCIAHMNGRALFSDDNHVNKYGAYFLAESVKGEVANFLGYSTISEK